MTTVFDGPRLDAPATPRPLVAVPADPTTLAPRWSALHYVLATGPGRTRSALWRRLQEHGALNLCQSLWAVPDAVDPDRRPTLAGHLDAAGATWSAQPVDGGPDDARLRSLLVDACDALWDPFFNAADRLTRRLRADQLDPANAAAVAELRASFAGLAARDILGDATVRAAERLDDLCDLCAADPPAERPPSRHPKVSVAAAFPLWDGRARVVVRVRPVPSFAWEQELRALEDYAFGADPARPVVRHGTVLLVCEPDQVGTAPARIAERVALLPTAR